MNTYHAALWSDSSSSDDDTRYRTTHHKLTKQRGMEEQRFQDSWTWEEILDGKGPWRQAGEYHRPKEELEAAKAERWRYEARQRSRHERKPPQKLFGRHTVESGYRPEPTPRAYRRERGTGQAPCYAVKRTVSPVHVHSLVWTG